MENTLNKQSKYIKKNPQEIRQKENIMRNSQKKLSISPIAGT